MAEILLYGIIGDSFDKLDAKTVVATIRASSGPLSVRINSPGGYVMEGLAIVEALRTYPGKVTTYVDGLAASMASVIAMVGTEVVMAESALMMIHKPWDSSIGNAEDLRRDAAKLDRIEDQLIGIYARRTGKGETELAEMLAAETWMTAEEALAGGFVTSISEPLQLAALDLSALDFRNTPQALKGRTMPPEITDTTQAAVAAERTRISTIMALGAQHRLPTDFLDGLVARGIALDKARELILDRLAEEGDALNIGHIRDHNGLTHDNPSNLGAAMQDAIYARMSGKAPEERARPFMGVSVVDMAREMLQAQGVRNAIRLRPDQVLQEVSRFAARGAITQTISDFPGLLQGAGERFLLDIYKAAASVLRSVSRQREVPDFRAITALQLSGFGLLETVNEAGEFKSGSFSESKNSYKLGTFGKVFNLSRQALINDNLGAFSDVLRTMGVSAAQTEGVVLTALLNSNPVLDDGVALFHATHGNLAASGGAPSEATLSAARVAMRTQKDLDGTTIVNVPPRFIVSGPAQETTIEKLLATINPATSGDVNVFAGKLSQLVDERITGNAWYLFGDPATAPVIERAYLNGETEPHLAEKDGWRVDGTEYKVRFDFGAGVVDHRGAYKNPGQ